MNTYLIKEYLLGFVEGDNFYKSALVDSFLINYYPDKYIYVTPLKLKIYYDSQPSFHDKVTINELKVKKSTSNISYLRLIQ